MARPLTAEGSHRPGRWWQLPAAAGSLGILVALLILTIDWASFDRAFYARVYKQLNTAAGMGLTAGELEEGTNVLLGYLRGDPETLDLKLQLADGSSDEFFNQREKAHMVDVKALYQGARCTGLLGLLLGVIIFVTILSRQRHSGWQTIWQGWLWAGLAAAILILILLGWVVVDFNGFWTRFHHVFFTNDLWLLDPRTDRLINMVPSYFFSSLVRRIITVWLAEVALLTAGLGLAARSSRQDAATAKTGGARGSGL